MADYIIMACQLLFALGVVPSLQSSEKPAFRTCLTYFLTLVTLASTFFWIHLIVSGLGAAFGALMWGWLTLQVIFQTKE